MSLSYAMTNVPLKWILNLVIDIERELESSAKTKASTPLHNSSFAVTLSQFSIFGIIFTHVLFAKGEKVVSKGLIFHSKYPFLAIHAKGGESISPKQKDRTTT